MRVAVIVLNYNGGRETLECLDSLNKCVTTGFTLDVIVVDNASVDQSVFQIKKSYPDVSLILNPTNLGFAEGNNVGIRFALRRGADFLLVLNNDTLVAPGLFTQLLVAANGKKDGGIFGPKIYFVVGRETHLGRYKAVDLGKVVWYAGGNLDWDHVLATHRGVDEVDSGQYNEFSKTDFVTGCALFARREVFETVGLFDSKFFLYYEDVDFCLRAKKKRYELYYVPQAYLWHKNADSAGGTGSVIQSYYITRNRLLIGMRYAPWRTKLALFREALKMLMSGTKTQRQAVGDFLRKKYGKRS